MAKKSLKRGLALGALMAFVITGNVWAANMTNQAVDAKADKAFVETAIEAAVDGKVDAGTLVREGGLAVGKTAQSYEDAVGVGDGARA